MTPKDVTGQESIEWHAESLRLTVFHGPNASKEDSIALWERLTGQQPDQQISRPREGVLQQLGDFHGHQLVLVSRNDRFDWIMQGMLDPTMDSSDPLANIENLSDALATFRGIFDNLWSMLESSTRLAFGAVLLHPATDLKSAYQRLESYLHGVELVGINNTDFLYQINRPRQSDTSDVHGINRINNWSVSHVGDIAIALHGGAEPTVASSRSMLACRLELDINTSAETSITMCPQMSSALFNELVELALEIVEHGDTK